MKILIAASVNEYSSYEEESIVKLLESELKKTGNIVDSYLLPYKPDPLSLLDQILAYNLFDIGGVDMLITIGYPACFINHHNKVSYLLETAPMLHEYWDSPYGILGNRQYSDILLALNDIEKGSFSTSKKVYCASEILKEDLYKRYNISLPVLSYPVLNPKCIACNKKPQGKYFIVETCLLQNSRFLEFLKLVKEISDDINLLLFIPNADEVYTDSLKRTIENYKLNSSITICNGQPSDDVIDNAVAYLNFPYGARRAENILKRCVCKGTKIITSDDSGYGVELSKMYENVTVVEFKNIMKSLKEIKLAKKNSKNFISEKDFAERMINI